MDESNPLLAEWTTPFGVPPFASVKPEHFAPAFEHAMRLHLREIEAVAADPTPPTFANTVEAMQRSGRLLRRTRSMFFNLVSSHGNPELETIELAISPVLAQHGMRVQLNPSLFQRIDALHENRDALGLEADQLRLLERVHLRFVRSGAASGPAEQARLTEISERLAALQARFGQNVLHDERTWCLPLAETDLSGLPDSVLAGARHAAAERGMDGHVLTLSRSLIEPFLASSDRRDLRQAAHEAWVARGTHAGPWDNRPLVPEILSLRAERARLLGYQSFAAYRLADTMAGTPERVFELLDQVWEPAKRKANAERDRLLAVARADGLNGPLEPWDWRYYADKVRRADYALDEGEVKPYFVLENVQRAAFETAERLFDLTFIARPDVPTYHPDVRAYEVRDHTGQVGLFLADHYARPNKRSGAWMSSYRLQENVDAPILPIVVNNNNFARAEPTLLSFDDAETLFHEFGHALHGLLSRVRYPAQSGTSVLSDFVELPSQIYERWLSLPETLRRYALHHETGEPIPNALMERLLAARGFNEGFGTVEYTAAARIDMALHSHPAPETIRAEEFEREFLQSAGVPPEIGLRHRPPHFQHLFAGEGYAAGYYSYLWAEVLDADGFEAFREAGDPFDPLTAARLRSLLSAGDTQDPMQLYTAFRGRPPSAAALLRSRDLAPT